MPITPAQQFRLDIIEALADLKAHIKAIEEVFIEQKLLDPGSLSMVVAKNKEKTNGKSLHERIREKYREEISSTS